VRGRSLQKGFLCGAWTFFFWLPAASVFPSITLFNVNSGGDPSHMASFLTCGGATVPISNPTYSGEPSAAGIFTGGGNIGINSGTVLATGDLVGLNGPLVPSNDCLNAVASTDPDLNALASPVFDAAVFEFDFVPTGNFISFQCVFASKEYGQGSPRDDVFGCWVNSGPASVALVPGTSAPISYLNLNATTNASFYLANPGGATYNIQMDGLSTVLNVTASVNPGVSNHMKLAIADQGDCYIESAVLLGACSLVGPTLTFTLSPTFSTSPTYAGTPTISPTFTVSPTPTISPTLSASPPDTFSPTSTGTFDPFSPTISPTFSLTATYSVSPTITPTNTPRPSATDTQTSTDTPSYTQTSTWTSTSTSTPTFTQTLTASPSATQTPSWTISPTPSSVSTGFCFGLLPPAPNPAADPGVNLNYSLCAAATVQVRVYTVSGEVVRDLPAWSAPSEGTFQQYWDLKNDAGNPVASGVFLCRFSATGASGGSSVAFTKVSVLR
jgi:hypothetical protein